MQVFALTGGIASGKSRVAAHFRRRIPVIDADELAREAVEPGSAALIQIAARFGAHMITPEGALDRKALGALVFADPKARENLNAIVHPRVRELLLERLAALGHSGHHVACYEVPLLFEAGMQERFRPVVLVSARPELQLQRIIARDGLSPEQASARIQSQMPLHEKEALADYVIDNNGPLEDTLAQADSVLSQVLQELNRRSAELGQAKSSTESVD